MQVVITEFQLIYFILQLVLQENIRSKLLPIVTKGKHIHYGKCNVCVCFDVKPG